MDDLIKQMRSSAEVLYYANSFKNETFILCLERFSDLENIIQDLYLLHLSHIRTLIICPGEENTNAEQAIRIWNSHGISFKTLSLSEEDLLSELNLNSTLKKGEVPVVLSDNACLHFEHLYDLTFQIADLQNARKTFFIQKVAGLEINNIFHSHPEIELLKENLESKQQFNFSPEKLNYILDKRKSLKNDVILIKAESGSLFQEVFTHRGAGTLLTCRHQEIIRQAELSDTMKILFLILPYTKSDIITSLSEKEIADNITDFYIYEINSQPVATARMTRYDNWILMGKICTLPRYQRKGRAGDLINHLLKQAATEKADHVFSLSIEPSMWKFLERLGFKETPRSELPEKWRMSYDLSRPSKAFVKSI